MHLAFLQERSEVEKKVTEPKSAPRHHVFFPLSNRMNGPSVVVTQLYRCLESLETAIMDDKLLVPVTGYPELYYLRFLLI